MLIVYLEKNYKKFNKSEIILIDELRKLRNNIVYYGQKIEKDFSIIQNKLRIKMLELIMKINSGEPLKAKCRTCPEVYDLTYRPNN